MNRQVLCALGVLSLAAGIVLAGDSTVPTDFATIQAAINDAGTFAGDTITVLGAHAEAGVHINKAVTIAGQGIGVTEIDGGGGGSVILYPDVDGVTIRDLTLKNCSQAVRFEKAGGTIDNTLISNVEMKAFSSRGIEVHNNTTVTRLAVTDSVFDSGGGASGFRISSSGHGDDVAFTGSLFKGLAQGIYEASDGGPSSLSNLTVRNCRFESHSFVAIFLEEVQGALIRDNEFVDNNRDIQLFKWYNAGRPMSDVLITNNTMVGTTNAVFAIFNADTPAGQTAFDGVRFRFNNAVTSAGITRVLYAGAHSAVVSQGGIGWETVSVRCNNFSGYPTPGATWLVDYYDPVAVDGDTLGGGTFFCDLNWWGTNSVPVVASMIEEPTITDFTPILTSPVVDLCDPPLAVKLAGLEAVETRDGVEVRWSTLSETDNAGFRVVRGVIGGEGRAKSELEIVTPLVIPSKGSDLEGAEYRFRDVGVPKGGRVFYLLEDVDVRGQTTRHGPVWLERVERFDRAPRGRVAR